MKYYVRKDAASPIEGPLDLDAIRGWIARGRFTDEFEAIEERGRTADEVRSSQRWDKLEAIFTDPDPMQAAQSPEAFLSRVRQNSCYKTLRLFINLAMIAAWAVSVFTIYAEMTKQGRAERPGQIALGLVLVIGVSVGLIAIRQSALLFADIADVLIEQNRKK